MDHQVEHLWKKSYKKLLIYSNRFLLDEKASEDVVSESFERLIIFQEKSIIRCAERWLFRVVRNECLLQLKYRSRSNWKGIDWIDEIESISERDAFGEVVFLLSLLSPFQKRAIELFYLEEKSYKEISRLMLVSEQKVKSYIQNGKRVLIKQRSRLQGGIDA